jgi:hypothetical protein
MFGEAKEKAFNKNREKIYRALVCFAYLKTYLLGLHVFEPSKHLLVSIEQCPEHLWVHVNANEWVLNSPWTPIECAWTPMSEYWTTPEHPLSAHDHHWVRMTTIEWVWMPNECAWPPLSHYWMWPWSDHEKDLICVRTEHALNACECTWMPVSEYWTPPECLWVHMNANEWVLNTPWTPIECTWMPMSEWEQPLNTHQVCMNAFE